MELGSLFTTWRSHCRLYSEKWIKISWEKIYAIEINRTHFHSSTCKSSTKITFSQQFLCCFFHLLHRRDILSDTCSVCIIIMQVGNAFFRFQSFDGIKHRPKKQYKNVSFLPITMHIFQFEILNYLNVTKNGNILKNIAVYRTIMDT